MKRVFLSLFFIAYYTTMMFGAKSAGTVRYVQQPDGTMLAIQLLGDEHFSWYQTLDGVVLTEKDSAFYVAATTGAYGFSMLNNIESISSTGILAHEVALRSTEEIEAINSQDRDTYFSTAEYSLKSKQASSDMLTFIPGYPSTSFSPHHGIVRIPIIMMKYTDMDFTVASSVEEVKKIFEVYFNDTTRIPYTTDTRFKGYSSAAQFFNDASNGDFEPVFELYGPYTTDHNHDYYGSHRSTLLTEAVKKADGDLDFSQYDSNDDGYVDIVYILYAGPGANLSNYSTDVWPFCSFYQSISTKDSKTINVIGCASELAVYPSQLQGMTLRSGIGVFCHEMSHGLGMPDLYMTTVSQGSYPKDAKGYFDPNNAGPEDWDLMDGGENLFTGIWPCQYNAWEKDVMGWLTPEELTEPATITIYPLNKEGGKAYRVTNPANSNEYYIIENNQKDEWNYYQNKTYGSGLMIWHINMSTSGLSMTPNNTYGKPNVTFLPADDFILASYSVGQTILYKDEVVTATQDMFKSEAKGDPYPGTSNVTSLAAYKNYTGDEIVSRYPITDITKNSDGSISFKFMGGFLLGDVNNDMKINNVDANLVTDYYVGTTEALPVEKAADVNKDGKISIADANQIVNSIAK